MVFLRNLICALAFLFSVSFSAAQSTPKPLNLTFTTIDVPGNWALNSVNGINNLGEMVGHYAPSNGSGLNYHGFTYSHGIFGYFDYPGADTTYGFGINDSGLIVGAAEFNGGLNGPGFIYDGTTFTTFNFGNLPVTNLHAINNAGDMVGNAGDFGAYVIGFRILNGQAKKMPAPGKHDIVAPNAINSLGDVAVTTVDGSMLYAYVYRNGHYTQLNFPGALETAAYGINDNGIVVGFYFQYPQSNAYAFNGLTYVSISYPGAINTFASAINNAGQVVGSYTLDNVVYHGFVTSPITDADFQ